MCFIIGGEQLSESIRQAISRSVSVVALLDSRCQLMFKRSAIHFRSCDTAERSFDHIRKIEWIGGTEVDSRGDSRSNGNRVISSGVDGDGISVAFTTARCATVSIHLEWLCRQSRVFQPRHLRQRCRRVSS